MCNSTLWIVCADMCKSTLWTSLPRYIGLLSCPHHTRHLSLNRGCGGRGRPLIGRRWPMLASDWSVVMGRGPWPEMTRGDNPLLLSVRLTQGVNTIMIEILFIYIFYQILLNFNNLLKSLNMYIIDFLL